MAKNFQWFSGGWCTPPIFTQKKLTKIKLLFKFFLKPCRNLMFFWPHKGGDPTKTFLRWDFLSTLKSCNFGPWWCGNLSTWNLFVPLILLPAKTIFFWNMVLCNVLGLANKHRTHEVAKNFQWFPGADVHRLFSHKKRKLTKIKFLFKFFLKQCRNLMFFGPRKGGNPTKAFLRWNFFPTVESGSFGPWWCGNLSTWNLFVPIMLLPAKTIFFEICCCAMF